MRPGLFATMLVSVLGVAALIAIQPTLRHLAGFESTIRWLIVKSAVLEGYPAEALLHWGERAY